MAISHSIRSQQPRGQISGYVILALVLIGVIALGVWGSTALLGKSEGTTSTLKTHIAKKGDLLVTVTEDGNVESAVNVDLKSQIAGGSSILWIIEDGTEVKKGDKLVEFDSSALEDEINAQKITYERAQAAKNQAEKQLSVAKIAVEEYIDGLYKQNLQDAQKAITIAMEDLRTAENALEHSQRMFRKGYVPELELQAQEFAVQRAKLELDSMKTAKEVLEKYTKKKTVEDLQSQVDTAHGNLKAEEAAFNLEESKLGRLKKQLENCIINAPQDGMVVWANEQGGRRGGQQQPQIEEGAAVRERQTIIKLPDLTQMQVKVNVHETKVESLDIDMRARISIQNRDLKGMVTSIASQPEPGSWFSSNVKEYATIVKIINGANGLKPGMTAKVEILVNHLKDVPILPVGAVVEKRGKYFCWVKNGEIPEKRELKVGATDDVHVEIQSGLEVGEEVFLNPRAAAKAAGEEPEELTNEEDENVTEKFGEAPAAKEGDGGNAGGGGPGRGGPGRGGPGRGGPGGFQLDIKTLDKDKDGKISKDEAPSWMERFFDRVAGDDGYIDAKELSDMQKRMQQRRQGGGERGGPGAGGGGPGAGGGGPGAGGGGPGGRGGPGGGSGRGN